jgi:hypothetical protein
MVSYRLDLGLYLEPYLPHAAATDNYPEHSARTALPVGSPNVLTTDPHRTELLTRSTRAYSHHTLTAPGSPAVSEALRHLGRRNYRSYEKHTHNSYGFREPDNREQWASRC